MTSVCEWMLVASITHLPSHVDHSGRGYPLTSVHSPGNEKTRFSCSTLRARDLLSKNLYTDLICILYDHATERYKLDAPTPKKKTSKMKYTSHVRSLNTVQNFGLHLIVFVEFLKPSKMV